MIFTYYNFSQKNSTLRLRVCIGVRHSECRRLFRQDEADQRGFLHDAFRGGGGQALQGQILLHQAKPSYINRNTNGPELLHMVFTVIVSVFCRVFFQLRMEGFVQEKLQNLLTINMWISGCFEGVNEKLKKMNECLHEKLMTE